MKRLWIGLGSTLMITLVGTLIYIYLPDPAPASTSHAYEYYYEENNPAQTEPEDILPSSGETDSENFGGALSSGSAVIHPQPVDTEPSSVTVLVNHLYTLPADYVPENLVAPDVPFTFSYMDDKRLMRADAAQALEELFAAASADGMELTAISGYRSYIRQNHIYLNNVSKKGRKYADQYSAPPGHSEHQTGLTMDVSSASNHFNLTYELADLPEGQWLKENAHRFGFIIRYPEDKEAVTGYAYEPWHIRFVGTDLAAYLYAHDLTLDEYYGISAENYEWSFDFNAAWKLLSETTEPADKEEPEEPVPEEETEDSDPDKDTTTEEVPEPEKPESATEPEEPEEPEENIPEENPPEENTPEDSIPEEGDITDNAGIPPEGDPPAESDDPESVDSSGSEEDMGGFLQ